MNAEIDKPQPTVAPLQSLAEPPIVPAARPPRRRVRRAILALLALAALAGGTLTVIWYVVEGRYIVSTDNAYVQGDIAVLGPSIEGDVEAIDVADNQMVKAGDRLISLAPGIWEARLAQARGALAEADAAQATAERQIEQQRATIGVTEAAIAQAQAELTRAAAEANRTAALVTGGWSSKQNNEQTVADRRKAEAALQSATAQKLAAQQALTVIGAQIRQAQAHRDAAAAAVRLAEIDMDHTEIRAPFDGVVGNRAAQLGEHVKPGAQLIAVAPVGANLFVVANFKETQLGGMRPGMKAELVPDVNGAATCRGRVDSIAPATGATFSLLPPENATGNFTKVVQRVPVKIVIDPDQAACADWLRPGLSVTAEVDTRGPDAVRRGLIGATVAALGGPTR